jgi:hypothetical protein
MKTIIWLILILWFQNITKVFFSILSEETCFSLLKILQSIDAYPLIKKFGPKMGKFGNKMVFVGNFLTNPQDFLKSAKKFHEII